MGVSKWSRDSATAVAIAALAVARSIEKNVVLPISLHPRKRNRSVDSSRPPRRLRRRTRSTVADVYNCLGPQYFRRAYRMSYESFLKLNEELREGIQKAYREHNERKNMKKKKKGREKMSKVAKNCFDGVMGERNYKLPPVPNGAIDSSIRLACALRYFAGGSVHDLTPLYGISHTEFFNSVWYVVQAIKNHVPFFIEYPGDVDKQLDIAAEFEKVSGIPFPNCAGCVDGILIWIEKPSEKNAKKAGIGRKKFLCTRKSKFGLNCQAVSDKRGRFLDISIKYGGSSSDCLAFEASDLCRRLEGGLLHPGLVLFGDNAYINTHYMVTPFPNVSSGGKDDYNFYQSQVSCPTCVCL